MVSCVVCGTSRTVHSRDAENPVTFHIFPKNPRQRQIWMKFVNKTNWQPTSRSLICSKHFADNCFDKSSPSVIRLKPQSVPTIYVQREKYVRTFNVEILTEATPGPSSVSEITSLSDDPLDISMSAPSTSAGCSSPGSPLEGESGSRPITPTNIPDVIFTPQVDDTPREVALKMALQELSQGDRLKSKKIRQLQRENWRLKRKIENLHVIIEEVKNKNLLEEEMEREK